MCRSNTLPLRGATLARLLAFAVIVRARSDRLEFSGVTHRVMLAHTIASSGGCFGFELLVMAYQMGGADTIAVRCGRARRKFILRVRTLCQLGADTVVVSAGRCGCPLRSSACCVRVTLTVVCNAGRLGFPLRIEANGVCGAASVPSCASMAHKGGTRRMRPAFARLTAALTFGVLKAAHRTARATSCALLREASHSACIARDVVDLISAAWADFTRIAARLLITDRAYITSAFTALSTSCANGTRRAPTTRVARTLARFVLEQMTGSATRSLHSAAVALVANVAGRTLAVRVCTRSFRLIFASLTNAVTLANTIYRLARRNNLKLRVLADRVSRAACGTCLHAMMR